MPKAHRIHVVFKLPTAVPELIVCVLRAANAMDGNPYFTTPVPTIASVKDHLTALQTAEANTKTAGVEPRNLALTAVANDAEALRFYVEQTANANVAEAAAIVASATMTIKGYTPHQRGLLEFTVTGEPGDLRVSCKALDVPAAYEWEMSLDDQTWTRAGITTFANILLHGIAKGATIWVRYRTTVGAKTTDWSDSRSFFMH